VQEEAQDLLHLFALGDHFIERLELLLCSIIALGDMGVSPREFLVAVALDACFRVKRYSSLKCLGDLLGVIAAVFGQTLANDSHAVGSEVRFNFADRGVPVTCSGWIELWIVCACKFLSNVAQLGKFLSDAVHVAARDIAFTDGRANFGGKPPALHKGRSEQRRGKAQDAGNGEVKIFALLHGSHGSLKDCWIVPGDQRVAELPHQTGRKSGSASEARVLGENFRRRRGNHRFINALILGGAHDLKRVP